MNLSKHHKATITTYIQSKDNNKPHLMENAFENTASLNMKVKSEAISFPSETQGLQAITNILVSGFNRQYENVYTFCMSDSSSSEDKQALCKWAVVMTDKETGSIRVGCGDYKWVFNNNMAKGLTILIEKMIVVEKAQSEAIFAWVNSKSYPWCDSTEFLKEIPESIACLSDHLTL